MPGTIRGSVISGEMMFQGFLRIVEAGRSLWRQPATGMALAICISISGMPQQARAQNLAALPELGLWLSQDHDGVFSITRCGGELCGRLVGMRYTGAMPRDVNGRPQCNLLMLTDFLPSQDNDGHWEGHILDPDTGHVYHANIWAASPDVLKLHGYIMVPLFGQTQTWTRYTGTIGPQCVLP